MKILISGANGVVGSDLVKFFSKKIKSISKKESFKFKGVNLIFCFMLFSKALVIAKCVGVALVAIKAS